MYCQPGSEHRHPAFGARQMLFGIGFRWFRGTGGGRRGWNAPFLALRQATHAFGADDVESISTFSVLTPVPSVGRFCRAQKGHFLGSAEALASTVLEIHLLSHFQTLRIILLRPPLYSNRFSSRSSRLSGQPDFDNWAGSSAISEVSAPVSSLLSIGVLSKAAAVKTHRLWAAYASAPTMAACFLRYLQRIKDGKTHRQLLLQRLHLVLPPQPPPRIAQQDESLAAM
jgi:hypothetical protein